MTRRERLEAKLDKRREWAEGREAKYRERRQAAENTPLPPGGEPIKIGHHSEKRHRKAFRDFEGRMRKAMEHADMAQHHEQKAAGLESQLERSIFSDDDDAIEALEAKAQGCDAKAERENAINKAWRKHKGDEAALFAAWRALGLPDAMCRNLAENAKQYSWTMSKGPCDSSYARAEARRCRERIKQIKVRQERADEADAAGGVLVEAKPEWQGYCRVTFAEKPEREIINALKAAGFRWGAGHWSGRHDALPAEVAEMAAA